MKKTFTYRCITSVIAFVILISVMNFVNAQQIRQDWHKNLPVYPPANQFGARVGVDFNGDAYWAVSHQDSSSGYHYVWYQKIDTLDNENWSAFVGGTNGASFHDLKTDISGNSYLYGTDYGGGAGNSNTTFLSKYNSIGTVQWTIHFDFDQNGEEVPDQIFLCPNGDIVATATEYTPQLQLIVGRFDSDGGSIWQTAIAGYEAGDLLVDGDDYIHLTTTYHLGPDTTDDRFAYILMNGNGTILNGFTQSGGHYSYALPTGGKGRTTGIDHDRNFYCLAWVYSFPGQDSTWTNLMMYKFAPDGTQLWSKRLDRVWFGYPKQQSNLLTDFATGELAVVGGNGMWRYGTTGNFKGGWYDRRRTFVDATMYNRAYTFALSAGIPQNNDSGKISHFSWTDADTAFYHHGRGNLQNLNETAIIEQDSPHVAMYVTWSYNGKSSLHRLVLRDSVDTYVEQNFGDFENQLMVFPNPATEVVTIGLNKILTDPIQLKLIDVTGRIVFEQQVSKLDHYELPVADFAGGVYQIVVTSGNNSFTKKLVIQ